MTQIAPEFSEPQMDAAWDVEAPAPRSRLISASIYAPALDAVQVLRRAAGQERVYWRAPGSAQTIAAFGVAAEFFGYGSVRMREIETQARTLFTDALMPADAPADARPRLFGGFAFRDDFVPDEAWSAFHPAHFILPHVQFLQTGDAPGGWLTLNALVPEGDGLDAATEALREAALARLAWLRGAAPATDAAGAAPRLSYPMSFAAWSAMLARALDAISTGVLTKVVLARACELHCNNAADGLPIETALAALNAEYPECYRFLFEPRPGHAFLGATPELLVNSAGRHFQTMALAGSQKRGATPELDAALEHELLNSAKDRHEHQIVIDALRDRLKPMSNALTIGATQAMKLRNIQHLYTPVAGELRQAIGVLPLLEQLHPTPALGGAPREASLRFIRAAEPLTRGWYAAPVGWLDAQLDGAFCVAIRSAVVQQSRAWLYAGCGIVAGSEAQKEWDETELKFRPMLRALGRG